MNNCRGALSVWVRHTSLLMCAVFFHVNIVYPAVEPAGKFWQERKAAAARLKVGAIHESPLPNAPGSTLLAQLPALELHLLPQGNSAVRPLLAASSIQPAVSLPRRSLPSLIESVPSSLVTLKDLYLPA